MFYMYFHSGQQQAMLQQQFMDENAEVSLEFHVLTIKKQVKFCYWCEGKKKKRNLQISRLKITAVQLCPLCRTSGANVTDGRRRQIIPCSALLFSAQLCRHPQLSWRAIWPIRGEGDTHTQTHRDWSVFPPWLRGVCLTVSVCVVALYLKQGRARKTTKTAEPSFLRLPLLQLPGDQHSAAVILPPPPPESKLLRALT